MTAFDSKRLTSLLADVPAITHTDLSDVLSPIARFGAQLGRAEFRVTLFGAAKTGKSSVLNALIGARLLATRAFRTNRAVTEVRYGPVPEVTILRPGEAEKIVDFDMVRRITDDAGRAVESGATQICVSVPLPLLGQGMVLVDTPGLLTDSGLDDAARDELMRADLAIMVLAADKVLSAGERAAAAWVNNMLRGNVVFVVNRMDLIDPEDRGDVIEWVTTALQDSGNGDVGRPRIFATSVRPGCQGGASEVSELAVWLEGLNARGRRDPERDTPANPAYADRAPSLVERLSRRSRLAVLEQQIEAAAQRIRAHHDEAVSRTRDLTERHLERVMVERSTRRQAISRAQRIMEDVPVRLPAIGDAFVRDSVTATRRKLSSFTAANTLHLDLEDGLRNYAKAVNDLVSVPVADVLMSAVASDPPFSDSVPDWAGDLVHPFDLSRLIFRMDVQPVVDPASRVAVDLGDLLTRVVDGGRSGREAGAAIGGWIGKNVLGEDAETETVQQIERLSREVLETVRAETDRYLAEVNGSLQDADSLCEAWMPVSVEVENAESGERELASALQWTDGLMLAVKAAERDLLADRLDGSVQEGG